MALPSEAIGRGQGEKAGAAANVPGWADFATPKRKNAKPKPKPRRKAAKAKPVEKPVISLNRARVSRGRR